MHPEQIKAALRMSGWTQTMLADDLEVSRSAIAQTIIGSSRSARIQERISEIIGKSVTTIWPGQVTLRRSRRQIEDQRKTASGTESQSMVVA